MLNVAYTDSFPGDKAILFRQYVSDPIAAQTISAQTIKMQILGYESNALHNMYVALGIRVVSNDGGTVRGTILSVTKDNVELDANNFVNRQFTATGSSVVAQNGDRIVVEIGTSGSTTTNHGSNIYIGDNNVTDLPENDTSTNIYNPWLEFAQTINFGSILGISDLTISSSMDNLTLVLPLSLEIDDLSVGISFENLELITEVVLSINDISCLVAFDNIEIPLPDTTLSIDGLTVPIGLDSPDIFKSNLDIDNLLINPYMDNLVLGYWDQDLIPSITLEIDDYTVSLMGG